MLISMFFRHRVCHLFLFLLSLSLAEIFNTLLSHFSCRDVSAGYFTPSANSVIYNFCPSAVSSSAVGSTSCPASSCPAGYGLYSSSCVPCPPGAYSAGGTTACTPVPAGRVSVKPLLKNPSLVILLLIIVLKETILNVA